MATKEQLQNREVIRAEFCTLLEQGPLTTKQISDTSGRERQACLRVLESLVDDLYVTEEKIAKKVGGMEKVFTRTKKVFEYNAFEYTDMEADIAKCMQRGFNTSKLISVQLNSYTALIASTVDRMIDAGHATKEKHRRTFTYSLTKDHPYPEITIADNMVSAAWI